MDWMSGLNRILRINEEELALLEGMAPNEPMRMMIRSMIAQEREESRVIRELMMGHHNDFMDPVF